jgi:hypothetical protein
MQEEGILFLPSFLGRAWSFIICSHHLQPFRNAWKQWQYSMMQNHIVTIQRHTKIDGIECGLKQFHNINVIKLDTGAYTCIMGIFSHVVVAFFTCFCLVDILINLALPFNYEFVNGARVEFKFLLDLSLFDHGSFF